MREHSPSSADRPRLISVVRSPSDICALISESAAAADGTELFGIRRVPIDDVDRVLFPKKQQLLESWQSLGAVREATADTLYHILVVAIESVPDLSSASEACSLPSEWGAVPASDRPTHPHPRAYKGTKYQPPKSRQLPPVDVRVHLCNLRATQSVVSPLWRFLPQVRKRLRRVGYPNAVLEAVAAELGQGLSVRRTVKRRVWTAPSRFVQYIWPVVRWRPSEEASNYLSLFTDLCLETDDQLLCTIGRLIAVSDPAVAYAWIRLAAGLAPNRRNVFVRAVLRKGACKAQPEPKAASQLEQVNLLATDEQFASWVEPFVEAVRDKYSVEYLLAGFRLAAEFNPKYHFVAPAQCEDFPEDTVEEIGIELADRSHDGWLPMALWQRCGQFRSLGNLIRSSGWRHLTREAAFRYFRLLIDIGNVDLPKPELQAKWATIREELPAIESTVLRASASYQAKAAGLIAEWLWSWDEPSVIKTRMPIALALVRRLSAAPFAVTDGAAEALGCMVAIEDGDTVGRFLTAPDCSFEAVEKACRWENDAVLISRGLDALVQHLERFTIDAFRIAPKKLARTARILGGVSAPIRSVILRRCREHHLFTIDPLTASTVDACCTIRTCCDDRYINPIPARLSSWARGEIELSPGRLQRYRRVLSDKLFLTRLDVIEHAVFEHLSRRLPVQTMTKAGQHALRLLGSLRENRRGLRKFLHAYWSGDEGYLSSHPATLAWYRKHRAVPRKVWEQGVPLCTPGGELRIGIEHDPFEILKLGTYAGTCLGIGGMCADSAVAVLLDVNKTVLYARDRRGAVVARQLLSIADDDRLVCFRVYPLSSSPVVKSLFREYDYAFARALGIPLYDPEQDVAAAGYQISPVLSVYWWDDYSWDFNVQA